MLFLKEPRACLHSVGSTAMSWPLVTHELVQDFTRKQLSKPRISENTHGRNTACMMY